MAEREHQTLRAPQKELTAAQRAALAAAQALGRGFDVTCDFRLNLIKGPQRLVKTNDEDTYNVRIPGDIIIPNVSCDIKCIKGERMHFKSEVLPFVQMSARFNEGAAIPGKVPLGLFNSMYGFQGHWQTDQQSTKGLALDGWFISLYTLQLTSTGLTLCDEIKQAVPPSWEPRALASFIEKYGTHIITSVKIGGKDVIYARQLQSSSASIIQVQKIIQTMADKRFLGHTNDQNSKENSWKEKAFDFSGYESLQVYMQGVDIIPKRRGGDTNTGKSHQDWLSTISRIPDVIAMTFVPISSLLGGVPGSGFLSQAIKLYLRFKPPIGELECFLEFQIARQWSPPAFEMTVGPQRKESTLPVLQFSCLGSKLFVSGRQVTVGRKLVTGLRLCLEGKRQNRLAIYVNHLSTLPRLFQPHWGSHISIREPEWKEPARTDTRYFEAVQSNSYSHVCTNPVEWPDDSAYIVTGCQLKVWGSGRRNVLYLRLQFSEVPGCSVRRYMWDHTPASSQKSGFFSQLGFSTTFTGALNQNKEPAPFNPNSSICTVQPKTPVGNTKLLKYVDVTEMVKQAQDKPGHWLVTGAKLAVEGGKVCIHVKYSILLYPM
ncbi:unnamed protein product [Sphagnum compactum]